MPGSLETARCLEVSKLPDAWKSRKCQILGSLEAARCLEVSKLRRGTSNSVPASVTRVTRRCLGCRVVSRFRFVRPFRDFHASCGFETSEHPDAFDTLPRIVRFRDFRASGRFDTLPRIRTFRDSVADGQPLRREWRFPAQRQYRRRLAAAQHCVEEGGRQLDDAAHLRAEVGNRWADVERGVDRGDEA